MTSTPDCPIRPPGCPKASQNVPRRPMDETHREESKAPSGCEDPGKGINDEWRARERHQASRRCLPSRASDERTSLASDDLTTSRETSTSEATVGRKERCRPRTTMPHRVRRARERHPPQRRATTSVRSDLQGDFHLRGERLLPSASTVGRSTSGEEPPERHPPSERSVCAQECRRRGNVLRMTCAADQSRGRIAPAIRRCQVDTLVLPPPSCVPRRAFHPWSRWSRADTMRPQPGLARPLRDPAEWLWQTCARCGLPGVNYFSPSATTTLPRCPPSCRRSGATRRGRHSDALRPRYGSLRHRVPEWLRDARCGRWPRPSSLGL
jgi:hypothetical protein